MSYINDNRNYFFFYTVSCTTLFILLDEVTSQLKMILNQIRLLYNLKNDSVDFSLFSTTNSVAATTVIISYYIRFWID